MRSGATLTRRGNRRAGSTETPQQTPQTWSWRSCSIWRSLGPWQPVEQSQRRISFQAFTAWRRLSVARINH